MGTTLETALQLAAQGFPVFPCGSNKRPSLKGGAGFHDATTDATRIHAMFDACGPSGALVGCPTGAAAGFDVLDLDYRHGARDWEQENAYRLPETRIHQTMSGGRHYLFRHAPGVRNTAGKVAPGIDVRGEGGYVILPPSIGYSVVSDADVAEWPDWLLDVVLKQPIPPRTNGYHHAPIDSKRIEGFVRSVVRRVGTAIEGGKHYALRNAALSLGGIQAAAGLTDDQARQMLLGALPPTVKDWRNAEHTIAWGLAHGRNRPIEFEDREPPRRDGHARTEQQQQHPPPPQDDKPGDTKELPLVYFEDIQPNLDAADFVEDLIVKASMLVVYGESNCGKTFFMGDLGLHIAWGKAWRGRAVDAGGVIYCALEGSHGISNRVAAFRKHHDLEGVRLPFAIVPYSINMLGPDVHKLIAAIKEAAELMGVPVVLVVIDTLSRALAGGNENAPDDMGALVISTDKVRHATGAALAYVHHCGKDAALGARGHSLLRAATDTEIEVVANGQTRIATVTKQRELPCEGSFPFTLQVVQLGVNRRGKPVTSCVVDANDKAPAAVPRKLTGHAQRAYEVLVDLCASEGQSGHAGTPSGAQSVPETWWRDRFYDRTPGDSAETKQKAFRRASLQLVNDRMVGMVQNRVWIVGT